MKLCDELPLNDGIPVFLCKFKEAGHGDCNMGGRGRDAVNVTYCLWTFFIKRDNFLEYSRMV